MRVKQSISLKAGLLATLATGWGQSEGEVGGAREKGGWLSSTHHSLPPVPPGHSVCVTVFGCDLRGQAPVQIPTGDCLRVPVMGPTCAATTLWNHSVRLAPLNF